MPWVRIDQNAMQHPKIRGLSDGAFRLWVEGLAYCQMFLTDGQIATIALKGLQAFSQKRRDDLLTAGLWKPATDGCLVHDYLEWNDSRAQVVTARKLAKERIAKKRGVQPSFGERSDDVLANTLDEQPTVVPSVCVYGDSSSGKGVQGKTQTSEGPPSKELAERAGRFIERYQELYVKHRKGARYVVKPHFDYQEALTLVGTWDDERLDKIAQLWLTTDHDFAQNGSRTLAQFRSMASWCDGRLREKGL